MSTSPVRYERPGSVALVTIDRPERRNAVDGATAEGLRDCLEWFEADDQARVLVLTGDGEEAFCAGADLKAIETLDVTSPAGPLGISRLTASIDWYQIDPPRNAMPVYSTVSWSQTCRLNT